MSSKTERQAAHRERAERRRQRETYEGRIRAAQEFLSVMKGPVFPRPYEKHEAEAIEQVEVMLQQLINDPLDDSFPDEWNKVMEFKHQNASFIRHSRRGNHVQ